MDTKKQTKSFYQSPKSEVLVVETEEPMNASAMPTMIDPPWNPSNDNNGDN